MNAITHTEDRALSAHLAREDRSQQAFDTVLLGLRAQGCASIDTRNGYDCMYRSDDGMKCAAGLLIPDSVYRDEFEGNEIDNLLLEYPSVAEALVGINAELVSDMQRAHDGPLKFGHKDDWEVSMRKIADAYGLRFTEMAQ